MNAKKNKKRIKVVDSSTAYEYLFNVVDNWEQFGQAHPQFLKALKLMLEDKKIRQHGKTARRKFYE